MGFEKLFSVVLVLLLRLCCGIAGPKPADTLLPGYLANIYTMLHGSGDERCLALYNRTYRKLAGVQVSVDGTVVAVCTDSVL